MSIIFIIAKYLAFATLSGVSMLLSYNMFSQLSTVPIESLLLSVVAIAIEALKIFSLVRGNTLYQLRLKAQAYRAYSMYAVLAILAVLASYGYTLTVTNRGIRAAEQSAVSFKVEANRSELKIIEEQIASLDRQIEVAIQRQQATPFDYIAAWKGITDQINQLETQKAEFVTRRLALNREYADLRAQAAREATQSLSTVNMFKLMAASFGVTDTFLMLALLLTISILIELGIISTSPTISVDKKHIKHILNEFAHDLHLDELEAERALEKAKRQQHIRKMYEDAGLQAPNVWPMVEQRSNALDSNYEPNETLRKPMKNPLDPSLPDGSHAAAYTPKEQPVAEGDISFFNALKTVLFKKSYQPESEHHEDEGEGENEDYSISSPSMAPLPDTESQIPVRQLHRPIEPPAPTWMVPEEDETISLTASELDQIMKDIAEEPIEAVSEDSDVVRAIDAAFASSPNFTTIAEIDAASDLESKIVDKPQIVEQKEVEPEPKPTPEPKPRRTRQVKKREKTPEPVAPVAVAVIEQPEELTKQEDVVDAVAEIPPTEPVVEQEPVKQETETETTDNVEKDKVEELHVGHEHSTARSSQPQEVGETKTYRFGKTTPEVKKLFVTFVDGLFKENGEEFLLDPAVASREAKIKPALGTVFIKRLEDLKGSTGLSLVTRKDDGLYYPNYTKEYIISYTTKEVNTQGRAV